MILSSNLRINLVYNMNDYLRAVLETQLIGAFRVAVTMPLEHILDRIKTYKQSRPGITYMEVKCNNIDI